MAIKQLTVSALTGGVLVLAYAAWSKWRSGAPQIPAAQPAQIEPPRRDEQPLTHELTPTADAAKRPHELEAIDIDLQDLWSVDDVAPNDNEQLVDFSAELEEDEDEGACVAPEGLGVRWLTRATEAMSPFHHALSLRAEAEAALLDGIAERTDEQVPESSQRVTDSQFELEFPVEKRG